MAQWYETINSFLITFNFCNAIKMNIALMLIISNRYGRKCLSILIQLQPCIDIFKVISGKMVHWYELINTFLITIYF